MNWTSNDIERLKNKGLTIGNHDNSKHKSNPLLTKVKAKMKHTESDLQIRCVEAFRLIYPKLKMRLFSIPNGGYRNAITASILQKEGSCPGASDLVLAIQRKGYGAMFIEMKTDAGRLSEYQIQFIKEMREDYYCCVCRSVEEFLREVNNYLTES